MHRALKATFLITLAPNLIRTHVKLFKAFIDPTHVTIQRFHARNIPRFDKGYKINWGCCKNLCCILIPF